MEHPINDLLKVSLENIKDMIDVETIIGDPVVAGGKTIIPISKVKFGFASGGTDQKNTHRAPEFKVPFGGATGGTVSITPIAFMVIDKDVQILSIDNDTHIVEKMIDSVPEVIDSIKQSITSLIEGVHHEVTPVTE